MSDVKPTSHTSCRKPVKVPIAVNINRTWEPKGTFCTVKIKKRLKCILELEQEEKEKLIKKQFEENQLDKQLIKHGLLPVKEEEEYLNSLYEWMNETKISLEKNFPDNLVL